MQSDLGLVLDHMVQLSRDACGQLDKDVFRIFALTHLCYLEQQGLCNDVVKKEFSSHLRRLLGHGHSLVSCVQFAQGKKGRAAMEKCRGVATQYLAQLPRDSGVSS
jgi:hypothetical protein